MTFLLKLWKELPFSKSVRIFLLRQLNDQFLVGVTGIIFNEKNEVLVLKHTYRQVAWSLPGGYLKTAEHPKKGLAREIEEETGFKVRVIRIIQTSTQHDGRLDLSYFGVYESGQFRASDEVVKHKFVSVAKLPKLMKSQYEQIRLGLERKKEHDSTHQWEHIRQSVPSFLKRFSLSK